MNNLFIDTVPVNLFSVEL